MSRLLFSSYYFISGSKVFFKRAFYSIAIGIGFVLIQISQTKIALLQCKCDKLSGLIRQLLIGLRIIRWSFHYSVTDNGFQLCEVGEVKVQMFNVVQMFNIIPMLKSNISAPISQNRCPCCTTKNISKFVDKM